jgi:hypothetical protein
MTCKSQLRLLLAVAFAACFLYESRSQADTKDNATAWPPVTAMSRPWTRWWWMGSAVDAANIDRELARYQAAGLGGVEVTPIYGVKGWEDHFIPYLSPKWMEMLDHAIATGKKLGMKTDMTTGTGWCFGGPTVSAKDANASVLSSTRQVAGGASLTGTFDPTGTQALVAYSSAGKCIELTNRINAAGKVDWIAPEGSWTIYAISQKPSGVMVKRAAPGGSGPMLNPFYPAAMTHYMQWFDAPFSTYKPGLNALFQDSYEYKSDWAPDFFAQFEKLRGYRLQTELPALLGNEDDDHAARVKSDYRETISDIMTDESMPVWVHWAHDHGYLARYQAHGDPGNILDLYAISDIPETEMIFTARSILVSKFASSAAHVAGKPIASAETGTWLSEHFTGTLADMKYLVDDMFLAGINRIVYHGTAYSPDNTSWPGWCFYASTEMNPRNSIWHDVPALNEYITRCQSILQSGMPDNDVLVYWPIYDNWNDAKGLVQNFDIKGAWFESQPIGKTSHYLWDHGYSFDYISDRQLSNIRLDKHRQLILGGCHYSAIIVPACHLMPLKTIRKLSMLYGQGIYIIFDGKVPDGLPGLVNSDADRKEFTSSVQWLGIMTTTLETTRDQRFKFPLPYDMPKELERDYVHRESMVDHPGIYFVRRRNSEGLQYFIVNRGDTPLDDWITLATNARSIELMDPMSGRTGLTTVETGTSGQARFHLQLPAGNSIIVRTFTNKIVKGPAWPLQFTGNPIALSGTWNVKFISGGPTLPAPVQTGTLASWTDFGGADAQAFAGTAVYSLTFDAPPGISGPCSIDLGKVCQSARVRLNGRSLGTLIIPPWRIDAGPLLPKGNHLEVEVTNVSANRIRDLDIRHIPWKIFYPPNVLSVHYQPLDASGWHLTESGLIGPVTLIPRGF